MDYLTIGSTPHDEPCTQLGDPDYPQKARAKCKRFLEHYVVFWSWFSDTYAMRPLEQHPASAPEIKFCGTRDQCAAWIANNR